MSQRAFERIYESYERWEPEEMWRDEVCLYTVSKIFRGRSVNEREEKQECDALDCVTLKRYTRFEMEIASGPCDSEKSQEILNGSMAGEVVSATANGDPAERGGMSGRFQWSGAGAEVVGRTLAVLNAGTHHDPLRDCEECHFPGHAEGWLRGAIIDGDCQGGRVNGAVTYMFEPGGDQSDFQGTFEGLIIVQCNPG